MSSTVLRPGLELGPYPEREVPHRSKLERAIIASVHGLTRRSRRRPANYSQVIRAINRRETAFAGLDGKQLQARTDELRYRLRQAGLSSDRLLIDAFALVRETAQRTLQMRHFDVQLAGGWAMLHGMIAEMETGEGKTLTATLPACAAALAGIPVHIITVNDYLVTRDAEWMAPVYRFCGLGVACIREEMKPAEQADMLAATGRGLWCLDPLDGTSNFAATTPPGAAITDAVSRCFAKSNCSCGSVPPSNPI